MKHENENFSAHESLDLIAGMIRQAQGNVLKQSFHFLLWGWVVALANLGMFVLITQDYTRPYLVWLISIPAWLLSMYHGFRQAKEKTVITHIDRITAWMWIGFGVTVFTLVFFGETIQYNLNPVILLMSSVPTFVSGLMIRFRPLMWGGVALWIFAIVCFLVPAPYQFLVGSLAVVAGYLIPGYWLKYKTDA
jgi:hypothetical protein